MASGKLIKRRLLFKRIRWKTFMFTEGIDTVWYPLYFLSALYKIINWKTSDNNYSKQHYAIIYVAI